MSVQDLHDLLLQAPLSQLNSVLADLRGLLSASSSTGSHPRLAQEFEDSLPALLKRFHEEQGKVVRLPGLEQGSIISSDGVQPFEQPVYSSDGAGPDHIYRDEARAKQFTYDHKADRSLSSDSYAPSAQSADEMRVQLDVQLRSYLRDHYPDLDPQRTNEGACGAVWRKPLRPVKLLKAESQETVQEEAMEDALAERAQANKPAGEESSTSDAKPTDDTENEEHLPGADAGVTASLGDTAEHEASQTDKVDMQNAEDEGELVEEEDGKAEADEYVLQIVSGKSNASNFWSGRLLSRYVYAPEKGTVRGETKLQIHYYENGNVQLNTLHPASLTVSTAGDAKTRAKAVLAAIRKHESEYHGELESTYSTLNEKAFKGLRRQLPVTRQKVDWDKVLNYRLGSDLASAQQQADVVG
ncbi:unnamed protein product [Parajaminaea phylloscopi]